MNIITGYTGTPHITSAQDRAAHQGIIGEGSYILNVGNRLAAEVISANEIRIRDGVLSHQGCFGIVESGTYDTLAIANGSQEMLRHDLIVCRYEKNTGTNVESLSLVVLQGAASDSSPADPAYNTGNIQNGDSPVDFPLYRVNIDGITIDSVDQLADGADSIAEQAEVLDKYKSLSTISFGASEDSSWVPARFVHGMGLIVELPVPGYTTVVSQTITSARIFSRLNGWQDMTTALQNVEIRHGILRITFTKTGPDYDFGVGDNALVSITGTISIS